MKLLMGIFQGYLNFKKGIFIREPLNDFYIVNILFSFILSYQEVPVVV